MGAAALADDLEHWLAAQPTIGKPEHWRWPWAASENDGWQYVLDEYGHRVSRMWLFSETEWQSCAQPDKMLQFLLHCGPVGPRIKASADGPTVLCRRRPLCWFGGNDGHLGFRGDSACGAITRGWDP
jgi:hypothetical protein